MNKFIACTIAAALMTPATAFAQQRIQVGKVYLCTIAQIENDVSLCANVTPRVPAEDLCVRVESLERYQITNVVYTDDDEAACPVPAAYAAATGAAVATNVAPAAALGLGGLGAAGTAIAAVAAAGALAAAAGGGSSNGTN